MKEHDYSKLSKWAQQDIEDMQDSRCTSFVRCGECDRLHDEGYCCPFCGHDGSQDEPAW